VKAKIFQKKLNNIFIFFLLSLVGLVSDHVPFFTRSLNCFSRTACCLRRLSSSIPVYSSDVYLVILGPRASFDYLRLILSNHIYHTSNSVSILHCLAQSATQPSLSLAIHNKFSDHLPRALWPATSHVERAGTTVPSRSLPSGPTGSLPRWGVAWRHEAHLSSPLKLPIPVHLAHDAVHLAQDAEKRQPPTHAGHLNNPSSPSPRSLLSSASLPSGTTSPFCGAALPLALLRTARRGVARLR
jgi:hypothetical protein